MTQLLNEYFDKIYVISIKRNSERLNEFLRKYPDLKVEVFQGIDGKDLFPKLEHVSMFPKIFFSENKLNYDRSKFWNKSQLGCSMSHLLLQKKIVEEKLNKVLILEDDALIIKDRIAYFQSAILELPKNWELFYVGYNPISRWSENKFTRMLLKIKHLIKPTNTDGLSSRDRNKHFFSKSYSKNLNIPGFYGGAHAYALSYEGVKKIVELDTPLSHGADTTLMYANFHKLINSYSIKKTFFVTNSSFKTSLIN
jgi:glycosyl transferase family 25